MSLKRKKKGDTVYMDCYSSIGSSSTGDKVVTDVLTKFDRNTGIPFKVLVTGDLQWDTRTGDCYNNKASMFYIE